MNIYEKKYNLRTSDFDKFNFIKPSSVLDLFQDAAGIHAEQIGVGFEEMKNKSCFWGITKIRFQIISQPKIHEDVIVKTWPLAPNRFIYRREYSIENEKGGILINGSSEWVIIHSEKRRVVCLNDLYSIKEGFYPKINFGEKLDKIEDFETNNPPYIMTPGFSDLDINNHVNNSKYANFVQDAVNIEAPYETDVFSIDYRKEVISGTELKIYYEKNEKQIHTKGVNDKGEILFTCKISCK